MARIKARALDCLIWIFFAVVLLNCSKDRQDCKIGKPPYGGATTEKTAPSKDALREMACDCASATDVDPDCAEDLWDSRYLADDAGCSAELDELLFCVEDGVEDGDACDDDPAAWACDAQEAAWRTCLGPIGDASAVRPASGISAARPSQSR